MGNVVIDIVLLVLGLLIILKFTISGFLKSLFSTCKLLLSVLMAFLLRLPVARLFGNMFFDRFFKDGVYNAISGNDTTSRLLPLLYNNGYANVLAKFDVNTVQLGKDLEALGNGGTSTEIYESISTNAGHGFSLMVCSVIAFVVVFILTIIVLSIIMPLLEKLTTAFDGVRAANRVLGLVFGVIVALFVLWGISLALYAITSYIGPFTTGVFDVQTLDKSMILGFFRQINLIDWIVTVVRN